MDIDGHKNLTIKYNISYSTLPKWFQEAQTENAIVDIITDKWLNPYFIWFEGIWISGCWQGSTWQNGLWKQGIWENGIWKQGVWMDGLWLDGKWEKGVWVKGDFMGSPSLGFREDGTPIII